MPPVGGAISRERIGSSFGASAPPNSIGTDSVATYRFYFKSTWQEK